MFQIDDNKTYDIELASQAIIRFQDCDPLRHLNNAKYFDYYFNAREDQILHHYNLTSADFFNEYKAGWVVYNHDISYIKSVLVSEIIWIVSSIIYYDEDTIVTEFYMTDADKKVLKNILWTTSKYIDVKTGRKMPHHDKVMQFLQRVTHKDIDFKNITKKDRIQQIKEVLAK